MEELLERKSTLAHRVDDESKDEDLNDWDVVSPGACMHFRSQGSLLHVCCQQTCRWVEHFA
jgi:hypothetical protein